MTPQEEAEARPVIHDFVEWMVWFLDRCIKLDDPFPAFRRSRRRALIRRQDLVALRNASAQFHEDWETDSDYGSKIANMPASELVAHGLYGAQLAAKMRMVGLQALRIERWYPDSPMQGGRVTQRRWFLYAAPPVTVEQAGPGESCRAGGQASREFHTWSRQADCGSEPEPMSVEYSLATDHRLAFKFDSGGRLQYPCVQDALITFESAEQELSCGRDLARHPEEVPWGLNGYSSHGPANMTSRAVRTSPWRRASPVRPPSKT